MKLTLETQEEILRYVIQHYFMKTHIERLVIEYLGNKSIQKEFSSTKDICEYLQKQGIESSAGSIRGTILRIRHKLLKYKETAEDHACHLTFPEQVSQRGYILSFEQNPHYRSVNQFSSKDPWLVMNWKMLRKQGYRGLWKGFSLPDGGRWPIKLYVWLNSVRDEKTGQEIFMCLLNSPSSTKHRIGILEGDIQDHILCMQGKWSVHYADLGIKQFKITVKLWPFRTSQADPVKISGRFVLHHEPLNEYQEGQIELDFCTSQSIANTDFVLS
ncbi:MAG: hypothetical protein HUU50_04140 [Candidatus Brocadiae bacterium]|nr:hypothetical protein [Candidatus Brocadiia bacterium]